MQVFNLSTKIILFPAYYFLHKNFIFGFIQKYFFKTFKYKNLRFNLKVKDLPLSSYSSFLFKTYEYNDRILVEKYIKKKNKCIVVGGGLGFVPALAYHKSQNQILVFEINKNIIKNLKENLILNNCKFRLFEKNLVFDKLKKKTFLYLSENFLSSSQYVKTKKKDLIQNIHNSKIEKFNTFNTLIIDGEGAEEYYINNLRYLKNIKYLIFECHHNIISKEKIKKLFTLLNKKNFFQIDKCFNSYYFKKF